MTIDEIRSALRQIDALEAVREALKQEEAKLADDLPLTPEAAVEVLRAHARGCLARNENFDLFDGMSQWVQAYRQGDHWAVYRKCLNPYTTGMSVAELAREIDSAIAFPMNVAGRPSP